MAQVGDRLGLGGGPGVQEIKLEADSHQMMARLLAPSNQPTPTKVANKNFCVGFLSAATGSAIGGMLGGLSLKSLGIILGTSFGGVAGGAVAAYLVFSWLNDGTRPEDVSCAKKSFAAGATLGLVAPITVSAVAAEVGPVFVTAVVEAAGAGFGGLMVEEWYEDKPSQAPRASVS